MEKDCGRFSWGARGLFEVKSIKNSSHSLTSCYVPSLGYSVVFRSFLTSICLSLFGSGDRSTCITPLLPWKYPGLLGALQSDNSSVFLFLPRWAFLHTSYMTNLMCMEAMNKHTHTLTHTLTVLCRILCFLMIKVITANMSLFMCSVVVHCWLCKSA